MLERIADGRTDLVFDYLAQGHAADSVDAGGVSLMQWCAYHGDVSAIRHLISRGALLEALGANLDLNGASFHGHWQLCQVKKLAQVERAAACEVARSGNRAKMCNQVSCLTVRETRTRRSR